MNWKQEQEDREYKQLTSDFISRMRRIVAEGIMRGMTDEQIREKNKIYFDCMDELFRISEMPSEEKPKLRLVESPLTN